MPLVLQEEMRVRWRPETHPACTSPTSGPSHQVIAHPPPVISTNIELGRSSLVLILFFFCSLYAHGA